MSRSEGEARGDEGWRQEPRVERLALAFDACCGEVERKLVARAWALNSQLQRTSASLLANVGEGLDEGLPGEQARFFDYARRAAGEAERLLKERGAGARSARRSSRAGCASFATSRWTLLRLIAWARSRER